MSAATRCEQCGAIADSDRPRETDDWLLVDVAGVPYDVCSRACAHALLDSEPVVELLAELAALREPEAAS